ncbi:MAG: hypothetical protein ACI9F9_002587 [Candidatus Paceibacteria bacterium]|jgi:hypothetical protein
MRTRPRAARAPSGLAGELNQIEIVEATPGAEIQVFYGAEQGTSQVGDSTEVLIDIANPRMVSVHANQVGRARVQVWIPEGDRGKRLLVQALDPSNCDSSNLIVRLMD